MKKVLMLRNTLIFVAVGILFIGFGVSYQNFTNVSEERGSLEKSGYEFMMDLREYDKLKLEFDNGYITWDENKFLLLTSDDILEDLQPETQFLIEVHDVSGYTVKYDRTLENTLAWCSDELDQVPKSGTFKLSSFVNIFRSFDEIHIVKLTVTVWK